MTEAQGPASTQRKVIPFSLKLSPGEMEFVEGMKAKNGLSAAENIRSLIDAFLRWFDLPTFMAAELHKQMEEKGLDQRQYLREVLARQYERTVHGESEGLQAPRRDE